MEESYATTWSIAYHSGTDLRLASLLPSETISDRTEEKEPKPGSP